MNIIKSISTIIILTILVSTLDAQTPFITTWKTDNPGTSNSTSITIPTTGTGYNYDVDWENDGVYDDIGVTGSITHNYGIAGTYQVAIRGTFPRIRFNNGGDRQKILSINQWGNIQWQSMYRAFQGCTNLAGQATDAPDLSIVTDLSEMFSFCSSFNQDISSWNVSNVTNMSACFFSASAFNRNISSWNVSNVTNMSSMFASASQFNQNIDSWNVSNVTNMNNMFGGASKFNQNISNWNVSKVTNMGNMFKFANLFNQNIGSWDVSKVTNMSSMFWGATNFNQNISTWDVSNVTTMANMFMSTSIFNQPIGGWNVSKVTNMADMFRGALNFNQNLSSWNVSKVTNMAQMFFGANKFDQDLGMWSIPLVTNMTNMLSNSKLSQNNYDNTLVGWASQVVKNNVSLGATSLTYCVGETARNTLINTYGWSVSGDTKNCPVIPSFITTWKTDNPGTSNPTSITIPTFSGETYNYDVDWNNDGIFDDIGVTGDITHDYGVAGTHQVSIRGAFPRIYFNWGGDRQKILSIDKWGNIAWNSMENAFSGCSNLSGQAVDSPNLSNVSSLEFMFGGASNFNQNIGSWNVSNVSDMSYMFNQATSFNQNISTWNVSNVTNMGGMFSGASSFNQNLNIWDVSNVTNMSGMFGGATSFNQNLNSWDVSNVTNMSGMFGGATSFNQNLNSWDVSNVTNMSGMFGGATSFNQNLNSWDVSNVTAMIEMFSGASSFNQPIESWNVSNVIDMTRMFDGASSFNQNLNSWDVSNVTNMFGMFYSATSFNQNISNWDVSNVTNMSSMFRFANLFNQGIGNWNVSNVTNMSFMFQCSGSFFNQNLNNWNVSSVTNISAMFNGATSFNQNLGNWNISNVTDMSSIFNVSNISKLNYDNTLIGWSSQNVKPNVPLGASGRQYCAGLNARNTLINLHGWVITGDVLNCPATCLDGVQNGDETGIDCGGSACPTCNTYFQDLDGDTYGSMTVSIQAQNPPPGYVTNSEDCDDTDPSIYMGSPTVKTKSAGSLWSENMHWNCIEPDIMVDSIVVAHNTYYDIPNGSFLADITIANDTLFIQSGNTLTLGGLGQPVSALVKNGGTIVVQSGGLLKVFGILHEESGGKIINMGAIEVLSP